MTVRTIGRMGQAARPSRMALARSLALAAGLAVGVPVSAPASAQVNGNPAPTPAPSSTFRLPPADDGREPGVQGPSDNGLAPLAPGERRGAPTPAPTPTPRPTPPAVIPTQPAPTPAPTPRRETPAPTPAPRPTGESPAAATPPAASPSATDTQGAAPATGPAADAPVLPAAPPPPADEPAVPAATQGEGGSGTPLWAWLLAGLAAAGAGIWYWRRRSPATAGAPADLAEPPVPASRPVPRAAPTPAPRPAPAPATPQADSAPRGLVTTAAAPVAAPLVTRPAAERRAQVSMALEIRGIRMTADQLVVAFALNLLNQGSETATGMMVRIALNQGSAMPEPVLGRFYDGAGGSVLRDDMVLAPGAGEQLSTEVMLPRAAIEPLMIGGKPMLIPVLAFDVTYHWDGDGEAFGQNAGSFVLGREQGTSGSEKLAPLPLDRPNLIVNRPAARTTAIRRTQ